MPALGIAQETGILVEWLKNEGEKITEGEPLLEIETDKTTVVLNAESSGILSSVTAFAGDEVPVASTIAWILAPGEEVPPDAVPGGSTEIKIKEKDEALITDSASSRPRPGSQSSISATPIAARMAQEHGIDLVLVKPDGGKVSKDDILAYLDQKNVEGMGQIPESKPKLHPASPKARELANEYGFDISQISGSGPEQSVLAKDVLSYQDQGLAQQPEEEAPSISRAWRTMAQRLTEGWQTVPHFYLTREIVADGFVNWLPIAQKQTGQDVTYTDLLIKVVATALARHPRVNASWIDNDIRFNNEVNVGLAVAVADGLLVPVIHNADRLNVSEISAMRKGIVTRARDGKLTLNDLQGGTFTISNLGMYGVDAFSAIVNPPQAAILAVGRIAERLIAFQGQAVIRPTLIVTISFDHRVVDGARGAEFVDTLVSFIEDPIAIL
jgi:pyruvate dehydrogenase E2 component (dihydrolipoamide acetyltransferase)